MLVQPAAPEMASVMVTAGREHACALTRGGAVKCWGRNNYGQLGDNTLVDKYTPVPVVGLDSGVTAVAAGGYHTCALLNSGGLKCWGLNDEGQLGDNTYVNKPIPVDVAGLGSGVNYIASGGSHTCALTGSGGIKCWGRNAEGQLGDGKNTPRNVPADVSEMTSGVKSIDTGGLHTCAVTNDGAARCWGNNNVGQLGNESTNNSNLPVDVAGLASGVTSIDAGGFHTCAMVSGGIKCWGYNGFGQLGDNSIQDRPSPVDVVGLGSDASAVNAGYHHTCAQLTNGGLMCWGRNNEGQLGDGTTTNRLTPAKVFGQARGVTMVSAGGYHTCAVTGAGVRCWGLNLHGQVGNGTTVNQLVSVDVVGLGNRLSKIVTGDFHSCALTDAGWLRCWGRNHKGQLGDGTTTDRLVPVDVYDLDSEVIAVDAAGGHTCAVMNGGGVKCWGDNTWGQLGDGTNTDRLTPVDVAGLSGIRAIALGAAHTCALTAAYGVKCWGYNGTGQLGDGTYSNSNTPVEVFNLGSGIAAIAAFTWHSCALTSIGGIKCWGFNGSGQLGDNSTNTSNKPVDVLGLGDGATAAAAGGQHSCALTTGGGARCWGQNSEGQLGDTTQNNSSIPVDVFGLANGLKLIAAGGNHSCALTTEGAAKCWGSNGGGQLGDGTNTLSTQPVEVTGLGSGVQGIAGGSAHTCAIIGGGGKCWGDNQFGQVGNDTQVAISVPVNVAGLPSAPYVSGQVADLAAQVAAPQAGLAGVIITTNTGQSVKTGSDGSYTFYELASAAYTLTLSLPGYVFVPPSHSFILGDADLTGLDFTAYQAVQADFNADPTSGIFPLAVVFTNTSSGDYSASLWDFGDGFTSTETNPTHTYIQGGVYTVTLTASGLGGSDTKTKPELVTVYTPVSANFTAAPTAGAAPLTVIFTNTSSGSYSASQWIFGDGQTSSEQNPIYTYTQPGTYPVTLTVSGPGGMDSEIKPAYIIVYRPVQADFTAEPREGIDQATVTFTNTSSGDYSASLWDFGDGQTSSEQNPTYTYTQPGSYTVTLTASGPGGSDSEIKPAYITVYRPVQASFTGAPRQGIDQATVTFTNTSSGDYSASLWDFGDGQTSPEQNPIHIYTQPGFYTVTLTISGPGGSDSETRPAYIAVHQSAQADFTATPREGIGQAKVAFTNTSTGDYTTSQWTFGDGATSALRHPTHTYTQPGVYTVTLTISGTGGTDTETKTNYVTVYTPAAASFSAAPTSGKAPLEVAFTNTSTGDYTTTLWAFGDGSTSTQGSPTHTYNAGGTYTVTLTVNGPGGSDTETKINFITVYAPVAASFSASPTEGKAPLAVTFTNTSTGYYTTTLWAFGDGGTSTLVNPTYTYNAAGTYTVTLTVSGPGGSDTETKSRYIVVSPAGYKLYLPLLRRSP